MSTSAPSTRRVPKSSRFGACVAKLRLSIVLVFVLFAGSLPASAEDFCGNFLCSCGSGENEAACPQDCGDCGDLNCDPYEDSDSCPQDCGTCGDLVCAGAESSNNCPSDCPDLCGDLICELGEDCPVDCGEAVLACESEPGEPPVPSEEPEASQDPDDDGDGDDDVDRDPLDGARFGGGGCSLRPD